MKIELDTLFPGIGLLPVLYPALCPLYALYHGYMQIRIEIVRRHDLTEYAYEFSVLYLRGKSLKLLFGDIG